MQASTIVNGAINMLGLQCTVEMGLWKGVDFLILIGLIIASIAVLSSYFASGEIAPWKSV